MRRVGFWLRVVSLAVFVLLPVLFLAGGDLGDRVRHCGLCLFYAFILWNLVEAAAGLWQQHQQRRRLAAGLCSTCGYNLTGNVSGVCPECGTAIAVKEPAR